MSQGQWGDGRDPQYQARQDGQGTPARRQGYGPAAVPPQFGGQSAEQWQPSPQPGFAPQPYPPQAYGQPQLLLHGYYTPPPVQVNVVQQNGWGPSRAVTQRGLGPFWTMFHLFMTCMTGGLWALIWYWHARSRRSYTTFR